MKALTLTQPWASLVAVGAKHIETRSWRTHYRGPLAIHAAAGFPHEARELCDEEPFRTVLCNAGLTVWPHHYPTRALCSSLEHYLPLGCIVAVCRLVDVRKISRNVQSVQAQPFQSLPLPAWLDPDLLTEQERAFGNYAPGRFAWELEDILRLAEPIPVKGALSLWEWHAPASLEFVEEGW